MNHELPPYREEAAKDGHPKAIVPGQPAESLHDPLHQQHLLIVVHFFQLHFDNFQVCRLYGPSNEGGLDRQFPMASVNEGQQLYSFWTTMIHQGIQRRTDGASGIQNVIDQHNVAPSHIETKGPGVDHGTQVPGRKVIAIEIDVERSHIDGTLFYDCNQFRQSLCQRQSPALDTDQGKMFTAIIFLDNFVRKTHEGTFNFRRRHQAGFFPQCERALGAFLSFLHILRLIIRGESGSGQAGTKVCPLDACIATGRWPGFLR